MAICVAPARWAIERIFTASPKITSLSPSKITGISFCASTKGRSAISSSARVVGLLLTKISFCGVTVMTICRGSDCVSCTCGRLMLAPDCTIATLVTMKMINSTRKMSVSGVMLISAMMAEPLPFFLRGLAIAIRFPPQAQRFEHAVGADGHDGLDAFELGVKVIVENDGDDGDGQAEGGGDQSLGDTPGDHGEAAAALD